MSSFPVGKLSFKWYHHLMPHLVCMHTYEYVCIHPYVITKYISHEIHLTEKKNQLLTHEKKKGGE